YSGCSLDVDIGIPPDQFHTHPPVVVRALPRLDDGFAAGRHAVFVHVPEPLAAGAFIHHHPADVLPDVGGGVPVLLFARLLVFVHKSQHRLGLHPPDLGGVVHPALALVEQGVVPVGVGADTAGQVRVDGGDLLAEGFVAQQGAAPVDQPAGLDVVAVAVQVDDRAVMPVEKDQLPVELRAVNFVCVDIQDAAHGLSHGGVAAGLVKPGVALKDVQQGVHG